MCDPQTPSPAQVSSETTQPQWRHQADESQRKSVTKPRVGVVSMGAQEWKWISKNQHAVTDPAPLTVDSVRSRSCVTAAHLQIHKWHYGKSLEEPVCLARPVVLCNDHLRVCWLIPSNTVMFPLKWLPLSKSNNWVNQLSGGRDVALQHKDAAFTHE